MRYHWWIDGTTGSNAKTGKSKSQAKLTFNGEDGLIGELVANEYNIIHVAKGTYSETGTINFGSGGALTKVVAEPVYGWGDTRLKSDASTVVQLGNDGCLFGVTVEAHEDAGNSIGILTQGQFGPTIIKNCYIETEGAGMSGLKLNAGINIIEGSVFNGRNNADSTASYLIRIATPQAYAGYVKGCVFVYFPDDPSYPFPESRIWIEEDVTGSVIRPINNCYWKVPVAGSPVEPMMDPDTYPSGATYKDPLPRAGLGGFNTVLPGGGVTSAELNKVYHSLYNIIGVGSR